MKTHLDLFSGIGGFAIAAGWAGYKTIAFCEIDEYAQRVLIKNFGAVMADARGCDAVNDAPIKERRSAPKSSDSRPRIFSDIRQLDGTQFQGVDLLTAGVPCQPASCAGKRRGKEDDRWLWPEALRVLREAAPAYAVFENPPGILSLESGVEFEHLLSEMEGYGYSVQPIVVPACAVDARHRRDRVWIVAHRADNGQPRPRLSGAEERQAIADDCNGCSGDVADANFSNGHGRGRVVQMGRSGNPGEDQENVPAGFERRIESGLGVLADGLPGGLVGPARWPDEDPQVPRTAKGVKDRVAKLRCLGNSIVPRVAYEILKLIANSRYEPA